MEELKKYLAPCLEIIMVCEDVLTNSREENATSDPYESTGNNWWD